jgi:hypothetical protein
LGVLCCVALLVAAMLQLLQAVQQPFWGCCFVLLWCGFGVVVACVHVLPWDDQINAIFLAGQNPVRINFWRPELRA